MQPENIVQLKINLEECFFQHFPENLVPTALLTLMMMYL